MSGLRPLGRAAPSAGLMAFLVSLGGCTNQNATLGVSVVPPEQAEVKLSTDVMPIFGPLRGGCTGCHGDSTSSANLNLVKIFDPSVGAVGVTSCEAPPLPRIARSNSDGSYLIKKLKDMQGSAVCVPCSGWTIGPTCGVRMPPGPGVLSPTDVQIIEDWINQGAKDN